MRLIDADKIRYAKDWVVTDRIPKVGGYNAKAIYRVTKEEIDAMPTVDAVPVVRCKDCRFSDWYTAVDGKRYCYCMEHNSSGHQEMDFCSYGEKDGDGNGV